VIDKASGRIVVIRPRYIKELIEHKIIRSRMGTAAILFRRGEASTSKLFFPNLFSGLNRDKGTITRPCYPNPKILLLHDPLLLLVPSTTLSYEDKLQLYSDRRDTAHSPSIISRQRCAGIAFRRLLTEIQPFPFLPKKFLSDTFSRSALLDHRRMSICR